MTSYVYLVIDNSNDKCYVGKTNDIDRRWKEHCSERTKTAGGLLLRRAIQAHGVASFSLQILGQFENEDEAYEFEDRMVEEKNTKSPNGYNLVDGGRGSTRPSDDVRRRMSESQKRRFSNPDEREKISKSNTGKSRSEETKSKMRQPKSDEHRSKLQEVLRSAREVMLSKIDERPCRKASDATIEKLKSAAQLPHVKEAKRQAQLRRWEKFREEKLKSENTPSEDSVFERVRV